MSYRVAGIDVHKRMLAVVITDVEGDGAYQFTRRKVGTSPRALRELAAWLAAEAVEEVVMESTAQYWRPVWETLERAWTQARRTREGAAAGGHPLGPTGCQRFILGWDTIPKVTRAPRWAHGGQHEANCTVDGRHRGGFDRLFRRATPPR